MAYKYETHEYKPGFYPGDEVCVTITAGVASTRAEIERQTDHGIYFKDVKRGELFYISFAAGLCMGPAYDEE